MSGSESPNPSNLAPSLSEKQASSAGSLFVVTPKPPALVWSAVTFSIAKTDLGGLASQFVVD